MQFNQRVMKGGVRRRPHTAILMRLQPSIGSCEQFLLQSETLGTRAGKESSHGVLVLHSGVVAACRSYTAHS
jgi:hypothetical protein